MVLTAPELPGDSPSREANKDLALQILRGVEGLGEAGRSLNLVGDLLEDSPCGGLYVVQRGIES